MGLRDIERKIRTKGAYEKKDAELLLLEIDNLMDNVIELKEHLKKLEKKWGKELKTNKAYYEKVTEIRRSLGLPEEIGVYEWKESPSWKDKVTGKGYYEQLSIEILELGRSLIPKNGGLISLAELLLQINKARPGKVVSAKDLKRALNLLIKEKLIPDFKKLENDVILVEFVSVELSPDHEKVLSLAARQGYVTFEDLIMKLEWNEERANRVLNQLVEKGIAIKDETYTEGTKYWFPGLASF